MFLVLARKRQKDLDPLHITLTLLGHFPQLTEMFSNLQDEVIPT